MTSGETSFESLGLSIDVHDLTPQPTQCVTVDHKESECIRQEYLQNIKKPNWKELMIDKAN